MQHIIDRSEVRKALFPTEQGPIITSRLQNDFYKLTMGQFIFIFYRFIFVMFGYKNRTTKIKMAEEIDEATLRYHLDHAKTLRYTEEEIRYLTNIRNDNIFMFGSNYLQFLWDSTLPDYDLKVVDGEFEFTPKGTWCEVTDWEIIFLTILSALRTEAYMKKRNKAEQDETVDYAAKALEGKIRQLQAHPDVYFSDFSTRRTASPQMQKICVRTALENLKRGQFAGTSSTFLAKELDTMPTGTNAHELQMVVAALADTDAKLLETPFEILRQWWQLYGYSLSIILPDTFGSDWMFKNMPREFANWKGMRPDSMDPVVFGLKQERFFKTHGQDPRDKLIIPSDGLTLQKMLEVTYHFKGRMKVSHGWGTHFSNDIGLSTPSIVVKAVTANGRPAVKLSDNYEKSIGPDDEKKRYVRVFGYRITPGITCGC